MERYDVTGMSCAACQARVEKAVGKVPGVTSCSVSLLTNSMQVEGTASPDKVITAVCKAGYGASLKGGTDKGSGKTGSAALDIPKDITTKPLLKRFIISLIFLLILMYFSMGHMMFSLPIPSSLEDSHITLALLQMVISAVILLINQKFFINGFKGALHGSANMDTLISLGSGASYIYSTVILFLMTLHTERCADYMGELYFESAAMIVTLVTLGKTLESYSKGKTTSALASLMKLRPSTAVVLRDGKEVMIDASLMSEGDIFIIKSGESIPADGIIIEGSAAIDESAITGESIPVDKIEGDKVVSATINMSGYIKCRAEHVGQDTLFAKIIETVSDASASKAPVARLADRISAVFVPCVLVIAFITALIWLLAGRSIGFSLARGITVLVVSCPCALGLATPVAIMAGNGVGAKNGILFKNAAALQELGGTRIVCMDKTGTVTYGSPEVTDIIPFEISTDEFLSVAAGIERFSEHPLAGAVVRECAKRNIIPKEYSDPLIFPGNGISAKDKDVIIKAGSQSFVPAGGEGEKICESLALQGKTPMVFSVNGKAAGIIAVADKIRDEAREAVDQLKRAGIKTVMITGDNENTARSIASAAGIDEVIAQVLPQKKMEAVKNSAKEGKTCMVGDGINDAPALAAADLGIAVGGGTDVALDSSDIVLMRSSLLDVPAAIRLSRKTFSIIKENLFWALIYNVILIPVAAGAFIVPLGLTMEPVYGAAAMSVSSFFVVTNALRLNLFDVRDPSHDRKAASSSTKDDGKTSAEGSKEFELDVEGMMCPHCEASVTKALEAIGGTDIEADHVSGKVKAVLPEDISSQKIKKAVKGAGYKVKRII